MDELGLAAEMTRPRLLDTYDKSMRFWAQAKGLLPVAADDDLDDEELGVMTVTVTPDTREIDRGARRPGDLPASLRRRPRIRGPAARWHGRGRFLRCLDPRARRPALPGLRRVRRVHPRPPPSRGDAAVHRQLDRHPLASRTFLEPVTAARPRHWPRTTPGDLDLVHFVNSGAEATEAGAQAGPDTRPDRAHHHPARVSRQDARRAERHRQPEVPGPVPAAAARHHPGRVRRPGRDGRGAAAHPGAVRA